MFQIWPRAGFQIASSKKKWFWNAIPAYNSTYHYFFGEFFTFMEQMIKVNIIWSFFFSGTSAIIFFMKRSFHLLLYPVIQVLLLN